MDVRKYNIPDFTPYFDGEDFIEKVRPSLPEVWEEDITGFSYVSPQDENATDSDNTLGSRTKPRKTIPEYLPSTGTSTATPAPEGLVCIIKGHLPYTGNGQEVFMADGTPSNPVWIAGEDRDSMFTSDLAIFLMGQCIIVENFQVQEDAGSFEVRSHNAYEETKCKQVCFRYWEGVGSGEEWTGGHSSAVSLAGISTHNDLDDELTRTDFILYQVNMSYFGSQESTYETGGDASRDFHGILINTSIKRAWVLECTCNYNQGDGIQIGVAQQTTEKYPEHIYIAGNTLHGNGENSFDVKKVRKCIFAHNDCKTRGGSIVLHDECEDLFVINNDIHNSVVGVGVGSSYRPWIVGNTFKDSENDQRSLEDASVEVWSHVACISWSDSEGGGIIGNTFQRYDRALELHTGGPYVENNLFLERYAKQEEYTQEMQDILAEYATDGTTGLPSGARTLAIFRNNYFDNPRLSFASTSQFSTDIDDLNNVYESIQDNDANSGNAITVGDSLDEATGEVLDGASIIDAGYLDGGYAEFKSEFLSIFGLDYERDLFGYNREQGVSIDVGANESGGSFAPSSPIAPSNPIINVNDYLIEWDIKSKNETGFDIVKDGAVIDSVSTGVNTYYSPTVYDRRRINNKFRRSSCKRRSR